jgi:hypothetical protein
MYAKNFRAKVEAQTLIFLKKQLPSGTQCDERIFFLKK